MATYPSHATVTAHWIGSPTLALVATAFITMEYSCIRLSNEYPIHNCIHALFGLVFLNQLCYNQPILFQEYG
jgi:hypothetical protein